MSVSAWTPPPAQVLDISDTIGALKLKLYERFDVHPDKLSLWFNGQLLANDANAIQDYNMDQAPIPPHPRGSSTGLEIAQARLTPCAPHSATSRSESCYYNSKIMRSTS